MELLDFLDATKVVVGLIVTVFGALSGLIVWMQGRMKSVATDVTKQASGSQAETASRVGHLEVRVARLGEDVGQMKESLSMIDKRVTSVERSIDRLATKSDLAELSRDFAALKSTIETHAQFVTGQLNLLFSKAMQAKESK